jgi:hypothetical protein
MTRGQSQTQHMYPCTMCQLRLLICSFYFGTTNFGYDKIFRKALAQIKTKICIMSMTQNRRFHFINSIDKYSLCHILLAVHKANFLRGQFNTFTCKIKSLLSKTTLYFKFLYGVLLFFISTSKVNREKSENNDTNFLGYTFRQIPQRSEGLTK